ncbi:MAG: hypothetical protein J6C82_04965 [Clostridia bacterium]|nr:hypothetical protein [Clostridia bacterium]
MLTEKQINLLPERIYERLGRINTEYLESIGGVIKEIGELRPSDVHRLQKMYDYGADLNKIISKLSEESGKNIQEIYEIFDIVAKENYDYAKPFYEAKAMPFIPYEENEQVKEYVQSLARQTVDEYVNLTQHTAFAVFAEDGKSIAPLYAANSKKVATSLSDTYTRVVDYAVTKAQFGMTDYNSAMREVMKALAASGIKTVDYATGYSRRLDTAVRQNILWGIKRCNQNVADMVGEGFGADGYEISYHSNPRPSHADMGGRQYAIGKARTVNGVYYPSFSDVEALLDEYNCLHFKFSILLGVSPPAYSEQELAEFKANDNKTFEFEGKEYTGYEGTQLQRRIETEIRRQKDLANIAKAAGDDDLQREAQYKINLLTSKYAQFSKASGLPTRVERMQVSGFKSVKASKKVLTAGTDDGIIKSQGGRIMNINNIDSPIEQRNTGKGNPNAILMFDRPLNKRQKKLLDELKEFDSRVIVPKKSVNMSDLSALTAVTGDEFAMFTKGTERLIIRGNSNSVNINVQQATELSNQGYKWSGHTHPGLGYNCLQASPGDVEILRCFKQKIAYIYNSQGFYLEFERK